MHAKATNWAIWAFTTIILQYLIVTASAGPVSLNNFNPIEKRSDEPKIEKRYFDNKKFVYDTGTASSKRSPVYKFEYGQTIPSSFRFNMCHGQQYCRRFFSSIGELASSFEKRSPITWFGGSSGLFFGAKCVNGICPKTRSLENQLKKRSPAPSENEESFPERQSFDLGEEVKNLLTKKDNAWWINRYAPGGGRRKRSLELDLDEELTSLLKKRWIPWWLNRFSPAGGGSRREELTSNEAFASILTKRWGVWWMPSRFWPGSAAKKRQELTSLQDLTSSLTKRSLPWWARFFSSAGPVRREEFTSDLDLTNMLTRRWGVPWWARFWGSAAPVRREELMSEQDLTSTVAKRWQVAPWWILSWNAMRKRRDGLALYDEELFNDQRRSGHNDKKILFTERWIAGMDSDDHVIEQIRRSPIVGPLILYWTMPMRRYLKDESQNAKREPVWWNAFEYRPGSHRRSNEAEEEREVQYLTDQPRLVKRGEPPKEEGVKREISLTSLGQKSEENVVRSLNIEENTLIKREPIFKSGRIPFGPPIRRSLAEYKTEVKKREPIFKAFRFSFTAPPRRRSWDEGSSEVENLVKRKPVFRYNRNNFGAPPVIRSLSEETSEVQKREPAYGSSSKYSFGHKRHLLEETAEKGKEAIKREVVGMQTGKEEKISKRSPILSPKGPGYWGTQTGKNTKREDANGARRRVLGQISEVLVNANIKRENGAEKGAGNGEQVIKRSPIFNPKSNGYFGTQSTENTKRDDSNQPYRREIVEIMSTPDIEKRSPIFRPTRTNSAYKGMQTVDPTKGGT